MLRSLLDVVDDADLETRFLPAGKSSIEATRCVPELIGVERDDPTRAAAEDFLGETRDRLRLMERAGSVPRPANARIARRARAEDVARTVVRVVVGDQQKLQALAQMVSNGELEDVRLVPDDRDAGDHPRTSPSERRRTENPRSECDAIAGTL